MNTHPTFIKKINFWKLTTDQIHVSSKNRLLGTKLTKNLTKFRPKRIRQKSKKRRNQKDEIKQIPVNVSSSGFLSRISFRISVGILRFLLNLIPANTNSTGTSMSYKHLVQTQITWFSQHGIQRGWRTGVVDCSEHQTVDHTNKLTGNDHDTNLCDSHNVEHRMTQTLQVVLRMPMTLHRDPTRPVHMCSQKFGSQNHTVTCLVRN